MSLERIDKIVKGLIEVMFLSLGLVGEDLDEIKITFVLDTKTYLLVIDQDGFHVNPQ